MKIRKALKTLAVAGGITLAGFGFSKTSAGKQVVNTLKVKVQDLKKTERVQKITHTTNEAIFDISDKIKTDQQKNSLEGGPDSLYFQALQSVIDKYQNSDKDYVQNTVKRLKKLLDNKVVDYDHIRKTLMTSIADCLTPNMAEPYRSYCISFDCNVIQELNKNGFEQAGHEIVIPDEIKNNPIFVQAIQNAQNQQATQNTQNQQVAQTNPQKTGNDQVSDYTDYSQYAQYGDGEWENTAVEQADQQLADAQQALQNSLTQGREEILQAAKALVKAGGNPAEVLDDWDYIAKKYNITPDDLDPNK